MMYKTMSHLQMMNRERSPHPSNIESLPRTIMENKKEHNHNQGKQIIRTRTIKGINKNKQLTELKMLYAKANGLSDKTNSIQPAAELYGVRVIAMVETKQIPPNIQLNI